MANPMLCQGPKLLRNGSSEALLGSPSATFLSAMTQLTATAETNIRTCLINLD